MIAAIHQPHYFPWLGYFDKMAKVDEFIIMDEVQFIPRSYMCRNSFLNRAGDTVHQTVTVIKKGYREKFLREITIADCKSWQNKHRSFFQMNYRYFPHFEEVMTLISPVFDREYEYLMDVLMDTIQIVCQMLNISTKLSLQSSLNITNSKQVDVDMEKHVRQCMDVIDICKAAEASAYLTGKGKSLDFIDPDLFKQNHISLSYQEFTAPVYEQKFSESFVPNISSLDMLFNCGIEKSRQLFWENVHASQETAHPHQDVRQ